MKPSRSSMTALALALGLPGAVVAAPAAASAPPKDAPGSVQAGVQALSDALAEKLTARSKGFRRLAVLPFEALDAEARSQELGRVSSELLSARLAARPGILPAERAQLDGVVDEIKRVEKGEISPEGAASLGKLLGANEVVLGSIAQAGPSYVLTARLVDAETGQILAAADQSVTREGLIALSEELVEVKSAGGAALRSLAMPGWGQIYNGDTARGVTYLTLFAGAAGTAIASAVLGSGAEDEYTENTAATVSRRQDANDHYDRVNYALIAGGVIWAAAVVDAWLTGRDVRLVRVPEAGEGGPAAAR
jgi:TolB-like protein